MFKELYVSLSINECLEIIKNEFKGEFVDQYVRKYDDKTLITILVKPQYFWRDNKPVLSIVIDNFEENTKIYGTITGTKRYLNLIDTSFSKYRI